MAFFWFIIVVVLLIVISRRKEPTSTDDRYAQGYWDGFREAGSRIAEQLRHDDLSRDALQAIVDEGQGTTTAPQVAKAPVVDEPRSAGRSAPAATPAAPVAQLSPAEQSLRNLNTLLYMGSFLLVAAAAAFVAAAMPADVRLVGLVTVVVLFYGAGMTLHFNVPRLRLAATAFIGTGLAILPFVGVALHLLGGVPEAASWFVISLVGLVAYTVAAVVLQSQIVSYLTMAFVLSLVSAAVATASLPIVWYFVALIAVSLLANLVGFFWPQRVPALFRLPIEQTGQIVTPLAVLASLFTMSQMTLPMYELLFIVVAAHYGVLWLQQQRYWQAAVVRGVMQLTLVLIGWDVTHGASDGFAMWWLGIAAAQALVSLLTLHPRDRVSRQREQLWLGTMVGLIVFGLTWWLAGTHGAAGMTATLLVTGLIAAGAAYRLRAAAWLYVGLVASFALPLVVGRWLAPVVWPWPILVGCYTILTAASLAGYYTLSMRRRFPALQYALAVSAVIYTMGMIIMGLLSRDMMTAAWAWALAGVALVTLSYLMRELMLEAAGTVFAVVAVFTWVYQTSIHSEWQLTAAIGVATGLLAAATLVHHWRGETARRTTLLVISMAVVALLIGNAGQAYGNVAETSVIVLAVAAIATLLLRATVATTLSTMRVIFTSGYSLYIVLAWIVSLSLPAGWQVLVYGLGAVIAWVASYLERTPPLALGGNILLVCFVTQLWTWLGFDPQWTVFGVAWICAGLLYGAYWLTVERADELRQWMSIGTVWVILAVASYIEFTAADQAMQLAAAGSIVAIGATMGIHGYLRRIHDLIEIAVYIATLGVQRVVGIAIPEASIVFYAHWWMLTLALVAWWRGVGQRIVRLMIGMALLTLSVGSMALSVGGGYQLLFLVEHIALLVCGVLYRRQWAIWWGIVASVLAVLYFLKDYLFLWLGFLGLVLIAIVAWRLSRTK